MSKPGVSATVMDVKKANRRLYDQVAADYESIDGRRDVELTCWIRSRLHELAKAHGRQVLLDIGSGSGVVTRAAAGIFTHRVAVDISPNILAASGKSADFKIAADLDALPLADDSVDVISAFAVLHHLLDTDMLAAEVARVLKPGGVFWSDHDMDMAFYRRFRLPLEGYRWLRGADKHYEAAGVDEETYTLAEIREDGVDGEQVVGELAAAGLDVTSEFHWFGLTSLTNKVFGYRERSRGWAPLLRIVAVKPGGK